MKQRFNKLLSCLLTATMCLSVLPAGAVQAAQADSIVWAEAETVPVSIISATERTVNFNEGWKFNLGDSATAYQPDFNDSDWSNTNLPHDFSIFQNFTSNGEAESGFLPGGTGWYRKSFSLPQALNGKSIVLNFDGAYKDTTVYVNGEKIGENHYGYTPFAFDLSSYVTCDGKTENLIAVKVENQIPSSRWYSGSGIFRDVTLLITNAIHVPKNGTYVTTPMLAESNGTDGTVSIVVDVQNNSIADADIKVRNSIFRKGSETAVDSVEASAFVSAGQTVSVESEAYVASPKLWSIEDPNLYYVKTEILMGSIVLDTYDTEFGFKWYEFADNTGFWLNGENVKINGVCMHHDQGALGSAAYHDAIYRQMSIMKDMGVNTIRVTHNPAAEVLTDICNELGLLVIEEAFDGWGIPKNGNSNDFSVYFDRNLTDDNQIIGGDSSMTWAEFTLKAMIKRDRNDASIILWSLGNEIQEGAGWSYTWEQTADNLIKWAKEVDTAHPLTSGSNNRVYGTTGVSAVNQKIYEDGGVPGYNYGNISEMTTLHQYYPVMLWSETVSPNNSRGIYTTQASQANADGKYHLTSYDTSAVGWGKTVHDSMYPTLTTDWIAGECVWTGFDYIGEPTPWNGTGRGDGGRGSIPNSSYFGIVETTGFPKDNFYLYRSQWNQKENTLHLVTAWDPNNMINNSGKTPVWIYSNAPKVELYRDGELIGTATRKDLTSTTTAEGHVHYEYTTETNNDKICSTTSGSGSTSLYSVFNVAFENGTISAKAFDETGKDITNTCTGNYSITTPDAAAKLVAYADKDSIDADGSSLSYITVDVTDANGNLKTTAGNEINFTLTGQGEIVGVDNGDQATVNKYQQNSVLTSSTSAKISAFSGKALVIVRSTKQTGEFTLQANAADLNGASVTVKTTAPTEGTPQLTYYNLSRHCYVPTGSASINLPAALTAGLSNGATESVPINWNAFDTSKLSQRGNFTITGSFNHSGQDIPVSITAHVYDPIGGVQGFSYYTEPYKIPDLPATAMVYYVNGDAFEEYPVTWDTNGITTGSFAEVNKIVTINGTVDVLGKTYSTKATVRVAEGVDPRQANVAISRDHLVDNGPYNDTLNSVTDGDRTDGENESTNRWTTWDHKDINQAFDNISITMDWATATVTDQINLFFYKESKRTDSVLPSSVKFEYALSSNYDSDKREIIANEWFEIGYAEPTSVSDFTDDDRTVGKSYKLEKSINPQAIRITFAHPANTFIGLNEIEVIGTTYSYYAKTSAALTSATFGGETIPLTAGSAATLKAGFIGQVEFDNPENAALTFIQESFDTVKVVTLSEDGKDSQTYTLKFTDAPTQASTDKLQNQLDEYKKLNSSLYTPESYAALQKAMAEIESQTGSLTESQLLAKLNELIAAFNRLEAAVNPKPTPDPVTPNPVESSLKKGDKITSGSVEYRVLNANKKTVAAAKLTNKKATKITIKDTITIKGVSCKVIQVSAGAFKNAKSLKTLTIGKNVTTIGKNAFNGCSKLSKVTFKGAKVTSIAKTAFKKTSSKKVTVKIPASLKKNKKKSAAFKKKLTQAGMSKKLVLK